MKLSTIRAAVNATAAKLDTVSVKFCSKTFDLAVENPASAGIALAAVLFIGGAVGCNECIKKAEAQGFTAENPMPFKGFVKENVKFGFNYIVMATAFYNGFKAYETLSELKAAK